MGLAVCWNLTFIASNVSVERNLTDHSSLGLTLLVRFAPLDDQSEDLLCRSGVMTGSEVLVGSSGTSCFAGWVGVSGRTSGLSCGI